MSLRRLAVWPILLLVGSCAHGQDEVAVQGPVGAVDLGSFEQALAPYGRWIDLPPYGLVWQPAGVPAGWQPYTLGHWEWTDQGWLWVSDEPWGRIVFHYGRWAQDGAYGWVWVPAYDWAPAWVAWRTGYDVIGWAPLGPGISIEVGASALPPPCWVFVPARRFANVPIRRSGYWRGEGTPWFERSRPAPPHHEERGFGRSPAYGGPPPQFVQRWSGRPIPERRVAGGPVPAPARPPAAPSPAFRPQERVPAPHPAPAPAYPQGTGSAGPGSPAARPQPATPPGREAHAPPPVYRGGASGARSSGEGRGRGAHPAPAPGERPGEQR